MTSVDRLAAKLAGLERNVKTLQTQPQLGSSSIENSAIQAYDVDGNLITIIGQQHDGSGGAVSVGGPVPPVPSGLTTTPGIFGVTVRWDGTFVGGAVVPVNFSRVEIHGATDPNFSAIFASTLMATIETPRGGEVTVALPYGDYTFRLVARSLSGKASAPSESATGSRLKVSQSDLAFSLAELGGGATIFYGSTTPVGADDGDMWLKAPDNQAYRYTSGAWVLVRDQGIVLALQEAQNAATAAASAQTAADAKVRIFRQAAAPTGLVAGDVNDLWIDTDDANKLYAWSGSAWIATDNTQIAAALTAANTANTTVATKITVFRQIAQPATTGRTTGDLWIDTDDANKLYAWSGSAWAISDNTQIAVALANASAAQLAADSKIRVFRQAAAPTGLIVDDVNDLWIDTDDLNKLYAWSGTAWVLSDNAQIATALTNAGTALNVADTKIRVFRQGTAPTGLVAGDVNDLWIDTDDLNKLYAWSGTAWVITDNTQIATALTTANTANTTAISKVTVFPQATVPVATGRTVGDLWIDTDDGNKTYSWSGSAWVARQYGNSAITNIRADQIMAGTVSANLTVTGNLVATNALITGVYPTAVTGRRVVMNGDPSVVGSIRFYPDSNDINVGTLEAISEMPNTIQMELRTSPFSGTNEGSLTLRGGNGAPPSFLLYTRGSDETELASIYGGRDILTMIADRDIVVQSANGSVIVETKGQAGTKIIGARTLDLISNQDIFITTRNGTTLTDLAFINILTADMFQEAQNIYMHGRSILSLETGNTVRMQISNQVIAYTDIMLSGSNRLTGGRRTPSSSNGAAPGLASGSNPANTIWFAWENNRLVGFVDTTAVFSLPIGFAP